MRSPIQPDLIDRIYECAFVPERWPGVLQHLATAIEAPGGSLMVVDREAAHWTASPDHIERTDRLIGQGWLWKGSFLRRIFALRHAGFLVEHDAFTTEELAEEPLWRDSLYPAGYGWGALAVVELATGERTILALNRLRARGPVERPFVEWLDNLRPHLARAILMSARLRLERARAAAETLASLGLPALVLDRDGKVLAANELAQRLRGVLRWGATDRVALHDKTADGLLRAALIAIEGEAAASVRSFPVRCVGEETAPVVGHVVPVRLAARDIFSRCTGVLLLTPVAAPQAPAVELVQSLFDLTPAEARVARGLASGNTLDEIASGGGVSRNTVRSHVRGALEKTGCRRQAELVALLSGVAGPTARGKGTG